MSNDPQQQFVLASPPEALAVLTSYARNLVESWLRAKTAAYFVEVRTHADEHWRRDNLLVRVVPDVPGAKRALGSMSFNYYHRDKLHVVQRRLDKRLTAFLVRITPRLESCEAIAKRTAAKLARETKAQARIPATVAKADEALDALEKLVGSY